MNKNEIIAAAVGFIAQSPDNHISKDVAVCPTCVGLKMFEAPILGFGRADDVLYEKYKAAGVIGAHFLTPTEWLPRAKTVISYFLPFTEQVKQANARDCRWPADEWLHARYEGQLLSMALAAHLQKLLSEAGYETIVPGLDKRYKVGTEADKFTSNWSERHVAFACGLGTFGLSDGLITKQGVCGRFGSILTEVELEADVREYENIHAYCIRCGSCMARCPAQAIHLTEGKRDAPCSGFLDKVLETHKPRYGCGKCQVAVPCESGIPAKP